MGLDWVGWKSLNASLRCLLVREDDANLQITRAFPCPSSSSECTFWQTGIPSKYIFPSWGPDPPTSASSENGMINYLIWKCEQVQLNFSQINQPEQITPAPSSSVHFDLLLWEQSLEDCQWWWCLKWHSKSLSCFNRCDIPEIFFRSIAVNIVHDEV